MFNDNDVTLDKIDTYSPADLQITFQQLYNKPSPKRASHGFLSANIAYRLQENRHGSVSPKTQK
jgi:hypothetical protein